MNRNKYMLSLLLTTMIAGGMFSNAKAAGLLAKKLNKNEVRL